MSVMGVVRCLPVALLPVLLACSEMDHNRATTAAEQDGNPAAGSNVRTSAALKSLLASYLLQIDADFSTVEQSLDALQGAIHALLESPSPDTLAAARKSWMEASRHYELTAIHRHFADAVLPDDLALEFSRIQYQLNHWPILPGYVDYVAEHPDGGIVHDVTISLAPSSLRQQQGAFGSNQLATGFHVLEFLLWGENPDTEERGSMRPVTDFIRQTQATTQQRQDRTDVSQLPTNRRRQLLQNATEVLQADFQTLVTLWSAGSPAYRQQLETASVAGLLSDLLNGITALLTEELLVRSLYPLVNGDLEGSLPAPFSQSSQQVVSAWLASVETLLLQAPTTDATTLDSLLAELSAEYAALFWQHFKAARQCLVVTYSERTAAISETAASGGQVVECIRRLTEAVDYLERIKVSQAATGGSNYG